MRKQRCQDPLTVYFVLKKVMTPLILLEKMAQTTTSQEQTTSVHLLDGKYPTGQKAPKNYKKTMRIVFDDDLPAWNYRAVPTKEGS